MDLKIIHEDNHLIAVNKASGVLVQGDITGDRHLGDMVKAYVKEKYNKPGDVFLGTIHRIDRPTSGAVIFARTSKALERMNKLFRDQQVNKTYLAITHGSPKNEKGELKAYLFKNKAKNKVQISHLPKGKEFKEALLSYQTVLSTGSTSLIEVKPRTGRSHQIRVQLSDMGHSILGDLRYGAPKALDNSAIALHCHKMEFIHPVKKEVIMVEAKVPDYFPWSDFNIL